jgi:hypothetical protein
MARPGTRLRCAGIAGNKDHHPLTRRTGKMHGMAQGHPINFAGIPSCHQVPAPEWVIFYAADCRSDLIDECSVCGAPLSPLGTVY